MAKILSASLARDGVATSWFEEAHHRITNDLAVISSLVRLQAQGLRGADAICPDMAREALLAAASRIDAVGRLHRSLCTASDDQVAEHYLRGLCADAAAFAGIDRAAITCRIAFLRDVPPEQLRSLGLLIHEMLLNALKYSHPAGLVPVIDVHCGHDESGALIMDVSDDGVGFPEGFDPAKDGGFGFRIMRLLADQLGVTLTFDSSPLGVVCQVRGQPGGAP